MLKNFLIVEGLLVFLVTPYAHSQLDKRQIGVLARSGALPSGKRLFNDGIDERMTIWRELLKDLEQKGFTEGKRSVASLARSGELPKRNVEAMARSGYLVKPATEATGTLSDLLDPDEFLGKSSWVGDTNDAGFESKRGGLAYLAKQRIIGKRDGDGDIGYDELSDVDKRNIASVKSFNSRYGKRGIAALRQWGSSGKRNLGAAKNFARENNDETWEDSKRNVGSALRFSGKRHLGAARNFFHMPNDKRHIGAARNFFYNNAKKNVGAAQNFRFGKRNIGSFARDGGFDHLKLSARDSSDYPWEDAEDDFDFDDFHDEYDDDKVINTLLAHKRNIPALKNFGKRLEDMHDIASLLKNGNHDDVDEFLGKQDSTAYPQGEIRRAKLSPEIYWPETDYYDDSQQHSVSQFDDSPKFNEIEKRFLGIAVPAKRHIGALARLGLLPSFHSSRYSRSGRAISNIIPFRENPPIRTCSSENTASSWSSRATTTSQLGLSPFQFNLKPSAQALIKEDNLIRTYPTTRRSHNHPAFLHKSL